MEELLSPPRLDGEQTEIYNALTAFTNGSIILKYPRSGQYRSAFVVTDLDDEPTDEAIVFYETPNVSDGSSLRLNFLDKQDGRWVSVYDFAAPGSEVESVMFRDLGDGNVTLLINYLVQSTSDRTTSVMTYKNGSPEEIVSLRNIYTDVFDADGNGTDDLFIISAERASGISTARIFSWQDDLFTDIGQVNMNNAFASIKNVFCNTCDEFGTRSIFIDYAYSDGSFSTYAIIKGPYYFYLSPALSPDTVIKNSNSYTPYIPCSDPDGDGNTEVPVTVPFPTYEESPRAEQLNKTVWYRLKQAGTALVEKFESFVGTRNDYVLIFPPEWKDQVTASVSISEGVVRLNRYTPVPDSPEETILSIFSAAEGNTSKYESDDYIRLGTSSSGYSYFAQPGESQLAPAESVLRELFILK